MPRKRSGKILIIFIALLLFGGALSPEVALQTTVCAGTFGVERAADSADARARKILKTMTLKEKIGQMFLASVSPKTGGRLIRKYHLGGCVLMRDSFSGKSRREVRRMINDYQKMAKINMLVAVDEEGGTVTRVSAFPKLRKSKFRSPRALYRSGGWARIRRDTREKAKLLKSLGINTNLAPVADVPYRGSDFIYARSISTNARTTAKYIKTVVREMQKQKVVSTLKHFPGYGGNRDTHKYVVRDRRALVDSAGIGYADISRILIIWEI